MKDEATIFRLEHVTEDWCLMGIDRGHFRSVSVEVGSYAPHPTSLPPNPHNFVTEHGNRR